MCCKSGTNIDRNRKVGSNLATYQNPRICSVCSQGLDFLPLPLPPFHAVDAPSLGGSVALYLLLEATWGMQFLELEGNSRLYPAPLSAGYYAAD